MATPPNFFKLGVDLLSRINYNKCVTESEVNICPLVQEDQKRRIQKMFGSVSGLMPKRNNALTPIAKVMVSQERRQLGKEYICFWNRKNNRNALPWKVERFCY